jgi:hypothetical protein
LPAIRDANAPPFGDAACGGSLGDLGHFVGDRHAASPLPTSRTTMSRLWVALLDVVPGPDLDYFPRGVAGGFVKVVTHAQDREEVMANVENYLGGLVDVHEVLYCDPLDSRPDLSDDADIIQASRALTPIRRLA